MIKLFADANYLGDIEAALRDMFAEHGVEWRIIGSIPPIVTFQLKSQHDEECGNHRITCTVESHYLRSLAVDMQLLGADNDESVTDKDKKWRFVKYDGNRGIFDKYRDGPAEMDVLEPERASIHEQVKDYSHVEITTQKMAPSKSN